MLVQAGCCEMFGVTDSEKTEMEIKKQELEKKASELSQERTKIDNQVKETKKRKNHKLGIKKGLDNEISKKSKEIISLSAKITSLNMDIVKKENEITNQEDEIRDSQRLLKLRMKSGFMTPQTTVLSALMNKDKWAESLSLFENQAKILKHDRLLIDDLSDKLEEIRDKKQQIEEDKRQVEVAKSIIEENKRDLDKQVQVVSQEVHDIQKEEEAYLKDAANLKKQMDELQAEISRICLELATDAPYVGGELCWPVPGFYNISSPYGPRSFDGFHTGTDIAGRGIYGKKVVAVNTGKVIFVNTTGKGPYGNYITVDHGGGIVTLYAHLSSFNCSFGQEVTKGQTIGFVGSTGNSTGPHLHFEIRVNGKHTNPMAYFEKQ